MIPQSIQRIIDETKRELERIYSDRLIDVILFGSYSRGDYSEGSDIDIAIILDSVTDFNAEKKRYFPAISALSLKHDIVITVVPFDALAFRTMATPLAMNVTKEGTRI